MPTPSGHLGTLVRLDEVLAGLSVALDLVEGQPMGHSGRSALIALSFADALALEPSDRDTLLYASLLKDAGCSNNAARVAALFGGDDRQIKADRARLRRSQRFAFTRYLVRHTRPRARPLERLQGIAHVLGHARRTIPEISDLRCRAGAQVVAELGLDPQVATTIHALDERYDGAGVPDGLAGEEIPYLTRIVQIAQTAEVWVMIAGAAGARRELRQRVDDGLLDPQLAAAFAPVLDDAPLWASLSGTTWRANLQAACAGCPPVVLDGDGVDRVARVFAGIIDRKSPFTARHSERVARIADKLAERLDMPEQQRRLLRRAALLHDIGKLGVSNAILDAPRPLSDREWAEMRHHAALTYAILSPVGVFGTIAQTAASHHERLDGSGYHLGLQASELPLNVRILSAADCYEALTARRPYRPPASPEQAVAVLAAETPTHYDQAVIAALRGLVTDGDADTLVPAAAAAD